MNPWLFVWIPAIAGCMAYFISNDALRRTLWLSVAFLHLIGSLFAASPPLTLFPGAWFGFDSLTALFLPITSILFLGASVYGVGALRRDARMPHPDRLPRRSFRFSPEAIFSGCMLLFLASMSGVILSRHFGLQWVVIEATTLASAPLIYYHRSRHSLEAAWKYLMICSVGIALALLGVFCLALAGSGAIETLTIEGMLERAGVLKTAWLKLAFIFILIGYGTKMGLAPLHTWLPDAHSEAPSPVSALLSGALLNCAFLSILRVHQVCLPCGIGDFSRDLFTLFGLVSMGLAGIFILHQPEYKRMLAYSSVEHMGILSLGVGLGAAGAYGSMLHALNHSLVKAMLFMAAGNILWMYRTKTTSAIRGILRRNPTAGALWLGGFIAIAGSPPFGTFLSEFIVLRTLLDQSRWLAAAIYTLSLLTAFVGMASIMLRMALGDPNPTETREKLDPLCIAPPLILGFLALGLGVFIPRDLHLTLIQAAQAIGGFMP
mgnify:CR=1 FL=1